MYKKLSIIFLLCLTNTSCSHLCVNQIKNVRPLLEDHFKTMKKEEVKKYATLASVYEYRGKTVHTLNFIPNDISKRKPVFSLLDLAQKLETMFGFLKFGLIRDI